MEKISFEELSQDPNKNLFGKTSSDNHIRRARTSITRINRRIEASLFKLNEIQEQHDRLKHAKLERIIAWLTVPVGVSTVPLTIDLGLKALPHLDHHLHSPILASSVLSGISIGAYFLVREFGKSFTRRFLPKERKKIQQINAGSDLIPG